MSFMNEVKIGQGVYVEGREDKWEKGKYASNGFICFIEWDEEKVGVTFGECDYEEFDIDLFDCFSREFNQWMLYK